jgi:MFS family permease
MDGQIVIVVGQCDRLAGRCLAWRTTPPFDEVVEVVLVGPQHLAVGGVLRLIMLPLAGKLSDSFGPKRVFLLCVGIFTLGSLLCAIAPSIWFLIFARGVQAVGGGGLVPSSVGIVAEQYPLRRAQAIGLLTSMLPIGSIIGPNLGGYILAHWTWREMFIINVPTASR